jgi:hypothetical protein
MKNVMYLFALLLTVSCKQGNINEIKPTVINTFPVKKELKSTVITVPPIILAPANMCVSEDKLIIIYQKKDTILDFFQLPECEYLFSDGIRGGGPDDFPPDFDTRFFQPEKNELEIITGYGLLKRFIIDYKNKKIVNIKGKNRQINTEYLGYPTNGFTILNDTLSFGFSQFIDNDGSEFVMINTETNKNLPFGTYPDWTDKMWAKEKETKPFLYLKNTATHPSGTKFAAFYGFFKRWRIYDNKTNPIRELWINVPPYSENINEDVFERMVYYNTYPRATSEYIYAVCKNRTYSDGSATDTELQVWDWNGNPVAVFTLDNKIDLFTISEKERKIYALNNDEGNEDKIYVYSIPEQ